MARRSMLRLCALLALLALLLPVVVMAEGCDDCFESTSPACCPASCCACCLQSPSSPSVTVGVDLSIPADAGPAGDAAENLPLLSPARDVFHVPKSSLA